MMHYPALIENGCEVTEREPIQKVNHEYLGAIFVISYWEDNNYDVMHNNRHSNVFT